MTSVESKTGAVTDETKVLEESGKEETLQERFVRFRKERQNALKLAQRARKTRDETFKANLRKKFVERARAYYGVPYAQKYHEPGTKDYDAPLFLDCCGLVRRIMDDLQEDFGFRIGRWNQAYQFDTLPIELELKDMKPGDLVFYSGDYTRETAKPQKHDMVHVEVFVGGDTGEATIGARWQKGHIQEFPTYKFSAKSYTNVKHYFRSIDTWLDGVCESICSEHKWEIKALRWAGDKRSIFSGEGSESEDDCDAGDGAGEQGGPEGK